MASATLPLDYVVDVSVIVSPQAVQPPQFNQALIVGDSPVIPSYGANARCRLYQGGTAILQAMAADGFLPTMPEYLAASFYVMQQPTPYFLWIGRQDDTAIGAFQINAAGAGYVVGDRVTVNQTGGANGVLQVATIGSGGSVTALEVITQGTNFTVAVGVPTLGGTGTGLTIDIQGVGENSQQAVQACRIASPGWYLFSALGAADEDNISLTEWAQSATPVCQNFFQTDSAAVLLGTDDIFSTLKAANYNRYIGVYSTTQNGLAPNNTYLACALMGMAMGRNTGLAGSYFILPYKNILGMTVEPLTPSQFLTITQNNGNAFVSYANTYNSLSPGITGTGQYFDQILGIDMLVSDIQYENVNALYLYPAIGQNDQGQSVFIHATNTACDKSVTRGFLSGGTWQGQTILKLQAGMSLSNGYLNQSPTYASLGQKPANRQGAPIYCAVILTGAVQSLLIAVYVQQ